MPDIDVFLRAEAKRLRSIDQAPGNRTEWESRREALRKQIFAAMGPIPEKPSLLEPQILGTLKRDGYRIEKLILQSRPGIWITASAYVPELKQNEKVPAVLVVHGHWAWARRDPTVQARCLGLVKLGFFVLAVDAFGAGERFTTPARGTYHGALYGTTLWPTGHTLLGMQVYDNRRAVDYLLSRPEVNGKLGITGASGGGNQTMYAGALDERFHAVVPVCSVGNYQAYLQAACCVCEVLPGALQFTEEGDVLGLIAPRALMVVNATKDGIQFSPAEAKKSVARAEAIYQLYGAAAKIRHAIFESPHDYNQKMREAMYGWMTLQLKGEGKGEPIAEPKFQIETPEELACFAEPSRRPAGFLTLPHFAHEAGKALRDRVDQQRPTHKEMWEATAAQMRSDLRKVLSIPDKAISFKEVDRRAEQREGIHLETLTLLGEAAFPLPVSVRRRGKPKDTESICLVLHPEGKEAAARIPESQKRLEAGQQLITASLRGTSETKLARDSIAGAPDHNSAEHSVWIGRSMLGMWVVDVLILLDWLESGPYKGVRVELVGIGPMALTAMMIGAISPQRLERVTMIDTLATYVTDSPYPTGTMMGVLVPGILKVGDIPQLTALLAPLPTRVLGARSAKGKPLTDSELAQHFRFTAAVFEACGVAKALELRTSAKGS